MPSNTVPFLVGVAVGYVVLPRIMAAVNARGV